MRKRPLEFKEDANGCWIVTSHRLNKEGYSYVYHDRREQRAHRLVYEACFAFIPEGLVVRHKCDNPSCINPEHLEIGTHDDNMMDRRIRNRVPKGDTKR